MVTPIYLNISLKSKSHLTKKSIILNYFHESPLKRMKNAFYFILKVVFVLEILTFLHLHLPKRLNVYIKAAHKMHNMETFSDNKRNSVIKKVKKQMA